MIQWGSCLLKISRHQHLLIGHFLVCMFHNINFLFWQCSLNTLGNCFNKTSTLHGIQGKSCGRSRLLLSSAPSPREKQSAAKHVHIALNRISNPCDRYLFKHNHHPRPASSLQHAPFLSWSRSSLTIVTNSTICESQQQQDL